MSHIKGNIVTLRAIERMDIELLCRWANDPDLQDLLAEAYFPSSFNFHEEWFLKQDHDQLNKRFAVETSEEGLIGLSSIVGIDWRNRHAHHGLLLGDKNTRGKGFGKDAVMTTMRYAFDELNLNRLNGGRIEYNAKSGVFYDNLGWRDEGVRRNYLFRKGRYWDYIATGVLKEDYKALVVKTNYWNINKDTSI